MTTNDGRQRSDLSDGLGAGAEAPLPDDVARCKGMARDDNTPRVREQCVECRRRAWSHLVPGTRRRRVFIDPPAAELCPMRIAPNVEGNRPPRTNDGQD